MGFLKISLNPINPDGEPIRTGALKTSSANWATPSILDVPPVITIPAGILFSKEDKYNNIKDFTVKSIQRIQDKGFDAGDIGIIVRDNNEAKIIAEF